MLLATTTVEDFDRFATIFSTKGAEVPPIMQQAGHKGGPQVAELGDRYEA
ncbi:MAG: hypothetical protein JWO02_2199 [Solirubrobacterales bacterium]|nr:hypothetical protein [Solirubrobacterales bacterium]